MADVPAYDRLGNKITVPSAQVAELEKMGGRVATSEELATERAEAAYQAQSTGMKVFTAATMLGPVGYIPHAILRSQGGQLAPEAEAYVQGVSSGMTGGLATAGLQKAIDSAEGIQAAMGVAGGKDAAKAYAQTVEDVKKAHGGLYTAGQLAGFIGGAAAGGPVARVGAAGEAIGHGLARATGIAAGEGALRRAASTALALGGRGAAEGALYSAAEQISDDMLGDHELAADKLFAAIGHGALYGFAGGAALGGGGSLAGSAVRGTLGAAKTGLSRAVSATAKRVEGATEALAGRAEEAAATAEAKAHEVVSGASTELAAVKRTAGEALETLRKPVGEALQDLKSAAGQKGLAYDQAWRSIGAGYALPEKYAAKAERFLPNGTRDVGETLMRKGIISAEGGTVAEATIRAAKEGTPAALIPKIETELATTGQRIGEITAASGATVAGDDVVRIVSEVLDPLKKKAGFEGIAKGVDEYGVSLGEKLGLIRNVEGEWVATGKTHVTVQELLEQRKALDELVWREGVPLNPSVRVGELRTVRARLEDAITDAIDGASGKVKGALAEEYRALKKDYFALSLAKDAAEASATKMAKNRAISPTDYIAAAGAMASGHFFAGPLAAVGHKVLRERGNAAAAVLLYRMSEMGTITRAISSVEETMGRAARGLLEAPKPLPLPERASSINVRTRAMQLMKQVSAAQADPQTVADRVTRTTEPLQATAPQVAGALSQRMTDAAAFLASKMPPGSDPDPFDPHDAPRLTDQQAHEFVNYARYVDRPQRFFEEAEHGKITPEGVETARALMPKAFAEFQQRTLETMADMMTKGIKVPYRQRERLGILLDIPAVPSQRPDHMALLQSNVIGSDKAAKAKGPGGPMGPSGPKRPMPTKKDATSSWDRLEGR